MEQQKTVREVLLEGVTILTEASVQNPYLDTLLLLSHTMGISKEQCIIRYPEPLPKELKNQFYIYLEKRKNHIPVSYIRGKKEFYGRTFFVDDRVLVPRPDTETLVEAVLERVDLSLGSCRILDLCTGTGCIGITLKLERPDLNVVCSDISLDVKEVFEKNCKALLGKSLPFYHSDLLYSIPGPSFHILVANPPYLREDELRGMDSTPLKDPEIALLGGGKDGLRIITKIIKNALDHIQPGGYLFLEADPHQMESIEKNMLRVGWQGLNTVGDLAGRERVIYGTAPEKRDDGQKDR